MPQSILIIEDDEPLRADLAQILEAEGFQVFEAAEADLAIRLFRDRAPDLVLLDLGISGDNGLELLRDMKMERPSIPVIIVSSRTHISFAIDAFKSGAWDYVTKPIASMDVFINGLRNCLSQSLLQRRVRDTQDHLLRLVQKLPVIIFIINSDLKFEFLNQTTEQILGFTPQEILAAPRSFLRRIVPEDRRRFLNALKKSLGPEGAEFHLGFRFLHKQGFAVSLSVQSIAASTAQSGTPGRIEGMIMDMTRNSYMDRLLLQNEKLNMLRAMTEEVAHEIRNPLVSLGGFARQLRSRYPEATETRVILEECNRLERLLHRITAYLEPIGVTFACCHLSPTVNFIMQLLANRLDRKYITCRIDLNDGLSPVMADQEFLYRIFIYLIGHGIDMVEESGLVRVTASESDSLVHIEVAMAPVCAPPADHDRLIMPFEDGEMNLAMCLRLVERIGGHLRMEQSASLTRLTISIPKCTHAPEKDGHVSGRL
jgi:PAS domain S-box-containing protein